MYAERKGWDLGTIEVRLRHTKVDGASHIERDLVLEPGVTPERRAKLLEISEKTPVTLTLKAGASIATRAL
jgi:putative redox protein